MTADSLAVVWETQQNAPYMYILLYTCTNWGAGKSQKEILGHVENAHRETLNIPKVSVWNRTQRNVSKVVS